MSKSFWIFGRYFNLAFGFFDILWAMIAYKSGDLSSTKFFILGTLIHMFSYYICEKALGEMNEKEGSDGEM